MFYPLFPTPDTFTNIVSSWGREDYPIHIDTLAVISIIAEKQWLFMNGTTVILSHGCFYFTWKPRMQIWSKNYEIIENSM